MKKRVFFIWSLLLVTIGSFGSNKFYQQVITEQFRNEIAGIALNDSFPSADRFGNLYPGTVAQNIINVLNTDPSGVQLTKSERDYVIAIVSGLRPVWSKMKAVYGFVGGNEWKHKWNWKDMRDLDAAFRAIFPNGMAHSYDGVQGNGATQYMETFFIPNGNISRDNNHMSIYSSTNVGGQILDAGARDNLNVNNRFAIYMNYTGVVIFDSPARVSSSAASSKGIVIGTRNSINSNKIFFNGNLSVLSTASNSNVLPDYSVWLGYGNNGNNGITWGGGTSLSTRKYSFFSIGSGLTDQQAIQMSNSVTYAQGILNRQ